MSDVNFLTPPFVKLLEEDIGIITQTEKECVFECGHTGPTRFRLIVYGEVANIKRTKLCHKCMIADLKKHVIRCALCGLPIYPNNMVSGYKLKHPPTHSHIGPFGLYLCCVRPICNPQQMLMGKWTKKGFVPLALLER